MLALGPHGLLLLEVSHHADTDALLTLLLRDCQFSDWKDGRPFPHKRICGKKLSEAEVKAMREADEANGDDDAPADAEAPMRIPDPAPGYRRSPALLQQLKLLKTTVFDYLVRVLRQHVACIH